MSVRSAQAITKTFTTRVFATGVGTNADSLPTGVLYVNGVANGATVTVTNLATGKYTAAVTLPTLALNDVVELMISATVSTIADAAVIWCDTKDFFAGCIPDVLAGAANGLFIAGSNAATTIAGLTTGALACTTITASGAVAFQSTFVVSTSTALGALSGTTVTFSGAVAFQSTFIVTGAVTFSSTFATTGTATFNALTVTNATTLSGAVSLGSTLTVTGTTTLAALALTTLTASGAVAFQSTFAVTGSTTLAALSLTTLTASGAVALQSTLVVTGATTLTGAVTATNAGNDIRGCVLTTASSNAIRTTQMTESYAADGVAPTLEQAIFLIQQSLHQFAISSTTRTVKKLDKSTTAATFTLDSATAPTSTTRAT